MIKKSIICTAALAFMMSFSVAAMADNGPENMVLGADTKKPCAFDHAAHQKLEGSTCGDCHHSQDADGKKVAYTDGQEIGKCASCHDAMTGEAQKKIKGFKGAAHTNCKGCHKAAGKGPTKCKECHPKKAE